MKIYKSKYGWSTSAHSTTKTGEKVQCYQDVQFKMGEEPKADEIEGKLIFKGADGTERECFFSSYQSKDGIKTKLVLVLPKQEQVRLNDGQKDIYGGPVQNVVIEESELPFY